MSDDPVREFVAELADEPCHYHDDCTGAGLRHGVCLSCKARRALGRVPEGTVPRMLFGMPMRIRHDLADDVIEVHHPDGRVDVMALPKAPPGESRNDYRAAYGRALAENEALRRKLDDRG